MVAVTFSLADSPRDGSGRTRHSMRASTNPQEGPAAAPYAERRGVPVELCAPVSGIALYAF